MVSLVISPRVSFSTLISMTSSVNFSNKTNVSLYAVIVLALAPFSFGRYLDMKSDMYFEKSVVFIMALIFREYILTDYAGVLYKIGVNMLG